MDIALEPLTLRFREPLATAFGELRDREVLVLSVTGRDGSSGRGEAAPLEPYDGVSLDDVRAALEGCVAILSDSDDAGPGEILDACRPVAELAPALAAIDAALWDRAGQRVGRPVCELIGDDPLAAVPVNATIGTLDRAGAAAEAAAAARAGYRCVKVKVGVGDDAGRVAAVRAAAGPEIALRVDANGAWEVDEAVRAIEALAPAGLELVEEPVHGVAACREVRERVPVRIAIDETAAEPGALTAAVADAVCLKVARCGGISGLLAQAALVRASGAEVYVSSTFDGPLGIAAGLHAAAALRVDVPCGLATLGLFEGMEGVLAPVNGRIEVPSGPGLGVMTPG